MADPFTAGAAIIGGGSSILSAILGVKGASESGAAARGQALYQAGVAIKNAQIAEQNSEYALNSGEQNAMRAGMKGAQQAGAIKAAQATSNLDVNSGSAKSVQESQKLVTQMDMNTIRSNAAKTAYDYRVQAGSLRDQAGLYLIAGANAEAASKINADASIIGAAGSVAGKWMQASQLGLFGGGDSGRAGLAQAPSFLFGGGSLTGL